MQASSAAADSVFVPSSLLSQAYTNMLVGNYVQAEAQYKAITDAQADKLSAWEGLLWAQNALGKYYSTLKVSQQILQKYPMQGAFSNYRAYALLNLKRFPEARNSYKTAMAMLPNNPFANSVSHEGLAYAYLGMDDYIRYTENMHAASALSGYPVAKPKPMFRTVAAAKFIAKDKSSYSIGQSAYYRSWGINLAYEDFYISGKSFRQSAKAELKKQFKPIDLSLSARSLSGDDERVYPAWQTGAELGTKLYPGNFALKPRIAASYSHYPRFDVQQLSLKPLLLWRDMAFQYAAHAVFIDNETAGTDSSHYAHQFQLNKALPYNFNLGLHYGFGNDTWMVDNSGVLIDTFNQNGFYYGVSAAKTIFSRLSIYAYYQKWKTDNLIYLSLSGTY
jgi:tetratricopeptide (TPR) repeat protein